MAEYIDRKAAIDAVVNAYFDTPEINLTDEKLKKVIDAIPAADVVPVVRCRDCKHFNIGNMECENEAVSTDHEGGASYSLNFWLNDFCSYGERKQEVG